MQFDSVLGGGGFGIVYKVIMEDSKEEIAIKRLMVSQNTNFTVSYLEMDITEKMRHPNILALKRFYDCSICPINWSTKPAVGSRDDDIALIFEVASCNLSTYFRKNTILEYEAQKIIVQLLLAVDHIHYHGYLHLDIKPRNILICPDNTIKLCDFGLARKYYCHDMKYQGAGSTFYTAPEVLAYEPRYDFSADIWSVGCVLHCIMSGKYVPYVKTSKKVVMDDPNILGEHLNSYLKNYTCENQIQDIVRGLPYTVVPPPYFTDKVFKNIQYEQRINIEEFLGKTKSHNEDCYIDFLFSMLQYAPSSRSSSSDLLQHEYLKNFATIVKGVTKESRTNSIDEVCYIAICNKKLRDPIVKLAIDFLIEARNTEWYLSRDEIIFTAIMLYDRFMIKCERKTNIKFNDMSCRIYFRSCLYIITKYYSSSMYEFDLTYYKFPLLEYAASSLKQASEIERFIRQITVWVYQVSPYDVMRDSSRSTVVHRLNLLIYFLELKSLSSKSTVYTVYEDWLKIKDVHSIQIKGNTKYRIIEKLKE